MLLGVVAGACGRTELVRSDGAVPERSYAVTGYVRGLRGTVTLANGSDRVTVAADGVFAFPVRLPDGAAYAVAVVASPEGERCTAAGGTGVVAGADVVGVAVTCLSTEARLASLSMAPGALTPAFTSDVTSYTAGRFPAYQQVVTLRAVPADADAVVHIGDADVESGAPVDLPLRAGAQVITVTVTAPSGDVMSYRIAAERTPVVYIKASNPDSGDDFGWGLAISGDTLAVGAIGESSGAAGINGDQTNNDVPYAGAVYVFRESALATWAQEAYVKASSPSPSATFGQAVALDGDTLVVGAPGESLVADSAGAVYVFERTGATWTETAHLQAANPVASDAFGASVALRGDTLAVGAPAEGSTGVVHVFERSAGVWVETAQLTASNADAGDNFGVSVAIDGDTIAVGAPSESSSARGVGGDGSNNDALYAGAAYLFARAGGSWTQAAYLKASNSRADIFFGASVAVSGDTVIVGADHELSTSTGVDGDQYARDSNVGDIGSAYVFVRQGTGVVQQAYLKAFGSCMLFGVALAVDGDTAVVGSTCGMAYGYARAAGQWSEGPLFSLRAQRISVGARVALRGGKIALFNIFDNSGAAGVDPPPTDAVARSSGGVYVFE